MDTSKHSSKAVSEWAKHSNEKNAKKAARATEVIDFENLNIEEEEAKAKNVDALGNALNANTEIEVKEVLTKEQKEMIALEAKVAKELKKNGPAEGRKASKNELKLIKMKTKKRRDDGEEEVYTDEELETAGFLVE